ncbi:MAG: anthranilate phosphoribosyltransferase [Acidobacteriota bacterium]|nr:anthranilate phosphoribosyltransferase [Acidobacteriota bacterium]MDH3784063.1 anthranilate phosphoribosyltransferase [Acidobacteriota bacterium]
MNQTETRDLTDTIRAVVAGQDLTRDEARQVASAIMTGEVGDARIAALLVALRMKGETVEEIAGFADVMRRHADGVAVDGDDLVDTCGTGGDGKGTFNISTVTAFVAAGAGCRIAKHGNRSVSSSCGSSDLLDQLGIPTRTSPETAALQLRSSGLTFLFAPLYHQAARHAANARREIGIRSIFNIVGPLTNPAGASRQLMGVFDPNLTKRLAGVLKELGSTHCLVVHGCDGMDEITLAGPTRVSELRSGRIRTFDLQPQEFGFDLADAEVLRGGSPDVNATVALDVLRGITGPERDIVLINSAAAIYVGGRAATIGEGIELARRSIDDGKAMAALDSLRRDPS